MTVAASAIVLAFTIGIALAALILGLTVVIGRLDAEVLTIIARARRNALRRAYARRLTAHLDHDRNSR